MQVRLLIGSDNHAEDALSLPEFLKPDKINANNLEYNREVSNEEEFANLITSFANEKRNFEAVLGDFSCFLSISGSGLLLLDSHTLREMARFNIMLEFNVKDDDGQYI